MQNRDGNQKGLLQCAGCDVPLNHAKGIFRAMHNPERILLGHARVTDVYKLRSVWPAGFMHLQVWASRSGLFVVLGLEPRVLHMLGKHSTTMESHLQPQWTHWPCRHMGGKKPLLSGFYSYVFRVRKKRTRFRKGYLKVLSLFALWEFIPHWGSWKVTSGLAWCLQGWVTVKTVQRWQNKT